MSVNSPQSTNASSNALSARRRRMLVDMGIDVWTSRSFNPEVAQIAVTSDVKIPSVAASDQPSLAEVKVRLVEATGAGMSAPKPAALEPSAKSVDAVQEVLQADRIHVYFAKKGNALYISEQPITGPSQSFVQDLLLFVHWQLSNGEFDGSKKPLISEFQWPVVATSGTPERALAAFLDKHGLTTPAGLGLISPDAMKVLKPWLPIEGSRFLEVASLAELATNAQAKVQLWGELGRL